MSKREFLNKLTEYLSYDLPEAMVREKVNFYSDYIDQETVNSNRRAESVIEELGDPQLIAHSIIDAATSGPDGIPGSADDVDYSEEIYGHGNNGPSSWNNGDTQGKTGFGGSSDYSEQGNETRNPFGGSNPFGSNMRVYNLGCLNAVLIGLIILFGLMFLLGVLSPILGPLCMILLIIWLFGKITGGRRW